jgi:hypothetical protein
LRSPQALDQASDEDGDHRVGNDQRKIRLIEYVELSIRRYEQVISDAEPQ